MARSQPGPSFEDEQDIEYLRSELALARVILELQVSKIHRLEAALNSGLPQFPASATRDRQSGLLPAVACSAGNSS